MTLPTVTVLIPVYNRSHTIRRALESVLAQDYPIHEVLIIDDGSSDELDAVISPFGDEVRVVRHPSNRGAAAARNTGIEAATGEFIAFLDSDDIWKPDKLTRQMEFMQCDSMEIACTGFETLSSDANTRPRVAWRPYPGRLGPEAFAWGCFVSPGSTMVAKRSLLMRNGGYETTLRRYEDWDLLLRLVVRDQTWVGYMREPLAVIYRGSKFKTEEALAGLEQMLARHHDVLGELRLARRFRSAIAFHRASVFALARSRTGMAKQLAKSLWLCPMDNWPFRVILAGKLRWPDRWR